MKKLGIERRRFPYPYRAMLALCSDLDSTVDWEQYWTIASFLNGVEDTPMGLGLDLEVGNTLYFDQTPGRFCYWGTGALEREYLREMIRGGLVDCIHSFGILAETRAAARRSLDDLAEHGCRLEVWIDHSKSVTNFGSLLDGGQGDNISHAAYHADLTIPFGVHYVCRGRATSIIGQDVPPSLRGVWTARHPAVSARALAKEAAKQLLGCLGHRKYALHGYNVLMRPTMLRDGSHVYEFMRCNPHWSGVGGGANAVDIGESLSPRVLNRLVRRQGFCIFYTHLSRLAEPGPAPFRPATVAAFRRLAEAYQEGQILVTTTRRLLGYARSRRELLWTARLLATNLIRIDVQKAPSAPPIQPALAPSDLEGLTFYVPAGREVQLFVEGRQRSDVRLNPPDHTGRPSVSLPWPRLRLPDLGPGKLAGHRLARPERLIASD